MILLYSLLYTEKHITKEEVVNDINNYEETDKYKNTIYEKEQYIPLSFYTDLFKNIYKVHIKLFNNNNIKKVVAVDGAYNNTNIYNVKQFLETSLNMGFYNITDDIPFDLSFCSLKNKNREGKQLIEFIDKNKKYFKNIILVADRGYCSYDLIIVIKQINWIFLRFFIIFIYFKIYEIVMKIPVLYIFFIK